MRKCVLHAATAMSQSDQKPEITKKYRFKHRAECISASAAAIYSFLFPGIKIKSKAIQF